MSKRQIFSQAQISTPDDWTNIGVFARADAQTITGGAIGYPNAWARFTISQTSAIQLSINPGAVFQDDVFYTSTAAISVNLQAYLPLVANDLKWVGLLVRGAAQTNVENRMFLTDVASGATVQQQTPVTDELYLQIVVQDGLPSPTPIKPGIAASDCCLAFVLLSATGISQIVSGEGWRLKSLFEIEGRVTVLEAEFVAIAQRTASLETDIANIAGRLRDIPRAELMRQIQVNLNNLNFFAKLPATARAYWQDLGLFPDEWDTTNASWLARIWTGVRLPWASITNDRLELLTAGDPLLTIRDNLALPVWTEKTRIAVEGNDGYKDISQQVHTVTTAVQNTISRTSVSYGPTINICQNLTGYAGVAGAEIGQTFSANGQTYVSDGLSTAKTDSDIYGYGKGDPANWNADPNSAGHKIYAVRELQISSYTDTYWTYVTNTYGVNGSIYGQTFLNSQAMIATSIDLLFTRVDNTGGDVHLFLCETTATAGPNWEAVLAKVTVACGSLVVGWNKFSVAPTLLDPGKRYAWFVVTVGNHALATVKDNKYAQGSLFWATDGVLAQGDPLNDFAFRLNAAQFSSTRTVIDFRPISLENGMSEIKLLYGGWAPAGTSLVWEIKPVGASSWSTLTPAGDANPLVGLPPLCQLRATFVGTTDLAPALVLDSNARVWAGRMQGAMTAVSKQHGFGFASSSISVVTVVDNYDPNLHTFANKLMLANGSILTPAVTSQAGDPSNAARVTFTSTFMPGSPQVSAAVMPTLTTSTVVKAPFVESIALFAA